MSRPTTFEDKWGSAGRWSNSVTQQQWRVISSTGNQRQRLQKVVMNTVDGGNAVRSRAWNNAYELSQDLHAKQVEILEKKYGGSWRSRHAATIIQRAYRHYCLTRNFAKLRWEAEKRLSRRFAEFSHSRTVWSDLASTIQKEESGNEAERAHVEMTYSEYDNIMTHSYSSDNMLHHFMSQKTSRAYRQTTIRPTERGLTTTNAKNTLALDRCNLDFDFGRLDSQVGECVAETMAEQLPAAENSYVSGHGQFELSDSGESVLNSPLEPMVDLPSACFENQLEKQVAEVLDDSFSSESCEDGDLTPVNESSNSGLCHDRQKLLGDTTASKGQDFSVTGISDMKHGASVSSSGAEALISHDGPSMCSQKLPVDMVPSKIEDGTLKNEDETVLSPDGSPIWKRKSRNLEGLNSSVTEGCQLPQDTVRHRGPALDTILDCRETSGDMGSGARAQAFPINCKASAESLPPALSSSSSECLHSAKISDRCRKRAYRIGLNLFNKKPENGVRYLIMRRFLDQRPNAVAKFLISRKGLSKQMVGEYLGNLQKPFNMEVLRCFANEIELTGLQIDVALRKFQSYFRMPGEAQKIERLMEAFATRYCQCNPEHMDEFRSSEMVFLLAFAIIMLNTDLHNSNIKPDRKMKVNDFIRNLRGIDGGQDIDANLLTGVYERIRACELKPGADHVSHVFRLEQMIFGNKPQLSLPHRRLVCYCRMYEVLDPLKRDKAGQHQRELFLFNDVLMITKIFNKKKKKTPLYSFRQMFSLFGMVVHIFESPFYKYGLRLSASLGGNVLIMLNARNEHDRTKFVDDLKESILEITEMESLRIEEELKKQKFCPSSSNFARYSKDSGVVDVEMLKLADASVNRLSAPECERLKKSPLCNSLVDIADHTRRGSGVSLDSGVASAESESVGSCQEPHRSSRFLGLPVMPNTPNQGP